ncbi:class I SAM-dependent methyltransferase [Streptosporangium lutulentum]|uniref:SAM-dependent methyltransferase n=1 Tax=Streptosporangium lutulentum TaxID=1461250 RepID=A0ABT9Q6V0_9ACTN|nr:class I SAM-dependent methyltransferase [Streptosporangium lutulentum]MDP9842474.1 SAM-dependent methyltransferase [Streptosporangium lutulentum]
MTEDITAKPEQDWEQQARNWIAWARRPGFDSYWGYRSRFLELVPPPAVATLDLGCGEGRVSRDLSELGHRVTGVDISPVLVEAAREAHPDGRYMVADAADLPFDDGAFDLVVAYNVLMDVDDLSGSVREAARVLAPGGRLVLAITHPITNTGRFDGETFVLDGSYFERRRFRQEVERDGLPMVFSGWDQPLSDYTTALETAGLLIEALREPVALRADGTSHRVPWHLWMRASRPA